MSPKYPCIRSGYCCKLGPCEWGQASDHDEACIFLGGDAPGTYYCARYNEIMLADPEQKVTPAFGHGCSSSMNFVRVRLLKEAS